MEPVSRRSFMRTAALGLATVGAAGAVTGGASMLTGCSSGAQTFADTIAWNCEYDVVIIGYGGAGAAAAITAAENNLKTLLVEKAPAGCEGGNSRFCSQRFLRTEIADRDKMITYMKEVRGLYTDNMSDDIIDYLVDGYTKTTEWFAAHGGYVDNPKVDPEFPEFINSDVAIKNYNDKEFQGVFWPVMRRNIEDLRKSGAIDVWNSCPAEELHQDPVSKSILGVKVKKFDKELNIRATKGIVLACGGFENNNEMIEDFIQLPYCIPLGSQFNTGDGIKMAQKVGADLWHMSATSGPFFEFQNPETHIPFRQIMGTLSYSTLKDLGAIIVGADGTRFVAETTNLKHGHVKFHGLYIRVPTSLPAYVILDEASRLVKPLYRTWSPGMVDEIEKGWVIKGDTLAELAGKIGLSADGLQGGVDEYNAACAAGSDPLGRPAQYLHAIGDGPYYAMPITPALINTQGGPARDLQCQVLDVDRNPIPNLYSAGELGSFYSALYQGAGNIAECIITGQDAIRTLLGAESTASPLTFTTVKQPKTYVNTDQLTEFTAGANQYLGSGYGISQIDIRLTMDGSKMSDIEVLCYTDTPDICTKAISQIPQKILESQSVDVDTVSGATRTSYGIINAVKDARSQAGL